MLLQLVNFTDAQLRGIWNCLQTTYNELLSKSYQKKGKSLPLSVEYSTDNSRLDSLINSYLHYRYSHAYLHHNDVLRRNARVHDGCNAFPDVDKELYGKHAKNLMKTDVKETEKGYEVDMDLPGFKKDEIQMELNDGVLTISAAKGLNKDEEDKKGNYIRKERYAGSMSRSFYVGKHVTVEDVHPKYENGILSFSVPKEEAKPVEEKKNYISIEG